MVRDLPNEVIADHKHVHCGSQETTGGLLRPINNGLVLINGGVEHDLHSGETFKFFDKQVFPTVRMRSVRCT